MSTETARSRESASYVQTAPGSTPEPRFCQGALIFAVELVPWLTFRGAEPRSTTRHWCP